MSTINVLPEVDVDEAAAPGAALLLDVREYDEWMSGHAPGAVHIPLGEIMARVGELDRGRPILCVCRSGARSSRVTAWLRAQGFEAANVAGGMSAWARAGHPVVNHNGRPGTVI